MVKPRDQYTAGSCSIALEYEYSRSASCSLLITRCTPFMLVFPTLIRGNSVHEASIRDVPPFARNC